MIENSKVKNCLKLPITSICAIYINTTKKDILLAINSLLCQKYIPDQILIIVDGPIIEVVNEYIKYLKKKYVDIVRIIYLENNRGLGYALKIGLENSKNEIIARFDSDDLNLKDRLYKQYKYLMGDKSIDILGSKVLEYKIGKGVISSRLKKVPIKDLEIKNMMRYRNPINHPSVIFRKTPILNAGSYRIIDSFEDYYLWLRCKKINLKFENLNEPLVAMRRESNTLRRYGFHYAMKEISFLRKIIFENLINFFFIIPFIVRISLRLLPKIILKNLFKIDGIRSGWVSNYKLEEYIKELQNIKI